MFWRIIVTTIAISCTFSREITVHARGQGSQPVQIKDVICVLLLSGLQKEDLDANTLAKLERHHVNIDDMNNESLRQECLKKTYFDNGKSTKAFEITENPNDMTRISTKKQNELLKRLTYSDDLNVDKQIPEIVAPKTKFEKINTRNIVEEKENAQREQDRTDKVTIGITMLHKGNEEQQVEYIKDQSSLDSMMKFWAKLNEGNTKAITEITTTHRPPPTKERIETTSLITVNLDNVQSKDMEYISKMIAEYIGRQTVPTTTQISPRSTKHMDIVSRTIKELLDRSSKTDSKPIPKNMENIFGKKIKEFNDLTELAKLFQTYKNEEDTTEKVLLMKQKIIYDDKIIGKINRLETKSYSTNYNFTPTAPEMESERKMQELQYFNNMLRVTNNRLNGPVSFIDVDLQKSTTNNKNQVYKKKEHDTKNESNNIVSREVQNINSGKDKLENVSADVIKEIAEKVKEIMMRDMKKEITTTERVTTITTTAKSTTANSTVKEPNGSNVIQTLMDFFKDYKTMKGATKVTTDAPVKFTFNAEKFPYRNILSQRMPPVMDGFNPYVEKSPVTDLKRLEINPYHQNGIPMPFEKILNPPLQEPTFIPQASLNQKKEYQMPPITIQTNSDEIPPLVIQVSKSVKVLNQHIMVTTQNPFEKLRYKKLHDDNNKWLNSHKYEEPLNPVDERNHLKENPTYAELTKKMQKAENVKQVFREPYNDRIHKIKERTEHSRDKTSELNQPLNSNHGISFSGPMESHHHVSPSLGLNHHNDQIVHSNQHHYTNRQQDFNHYKLFDRQLDINQRETVNEPTEKNNHESINQPADSSYRDIITREFLRLVGSNHDVINKIIASSPHLRRPLDSDRESRNSDAYERYEHKPSHPRYKVSKFHEKLEQVENRSQNKYESYITHNKATTERCCDTVASRDQMPLMKIKQRSKFDDTHFNNFIKSQQKVTDMLERILATKTKTKTSREKSESGYYGTMAMI